MAQLSHRRQLASIGVGTETDGSIIVPLLSRAGRIINHRSGSSAVGDYSISISQDTAGPMGRTVADVAPCLMSALASCQTRAMRQARTRAPPPRDYATFLNAGALSGARFGLIREGDGLFTPMPTLRSARRLKS